MLKNTGILLVFWAILGGFSFKHEYYVGLTEIEYNQKTSTYEIAIKVFTDDLELAVQEHSGVKTHLATIKENPRADVLIMAYTAEYFHIQSGIPVPLHPVGRESEMDVTWIYLESASVKASGELSVSNRMFMEIYPTQTHIVHYKNGQNKASALLRKGKPISAFNL